MAIREPGVQNRQMLIWLSLAAAFSFGMYLLLCRAAGYSGFPLDDAWIHQTYARNLALRGEWAFIPGVLSAGSTAPLWSAMLAAGYRWMSGPYAWTYFLGWLLLWGTAWQGERLYRQLIHEQNPALATHLTTKRSAVQIPWAGLVLIFEWHLAWSAGSGMETLLMTFLILSVLSVLTNSKWSEKNWFLAGVLIGLSSWVRPDGITLLGFGGLMLLLAPIAKRRLLRIGFLFVLGFGLFFFPYLIFNQALAGVWWPNTFYAKQAEYAITRQAPFWLRLLRQVTQLMVGVGIVCLPGFVILIVGALRRGAWARLAMAAWLCAYLGLYAWRLPVTYQHARYLIPLMPVFLVCGLVGMAEWIQLDAPAAWRRITSRAWGLLAAAVLFVFWGLGAQAYSRDVAIIETEMVGAARWIASNTEAGALVAAHDIGALGFFGERKILDLAGLISPEVIPFIRDQPAIARYLDEQGANYLMSFPGWYPNLVQQKPILFQTTRNNHNMTAETGMTVYLWKRP